MKKGGNEKEVRIWYKFDFRLSFRYTRERFMKYSRRKIIIQKINFFLLNVKKKWKQKRINFFRVSREITDSLKAFFVFQCQLVFSVDSIHKKFDWKKKFIRKKKKKYFPLRKRRSCVSESLNETVVRVLIKSIDIVTLRDLE